MALNLGRTYVSWINGPGLIACSWYAFKQTFTIKQPNVGKLMKAAAEYNGSVARTSKNG